MADFDFSTLITDRGQSDLATLRSVLSTPMEEWTAEQLAAFNQAASKGAYNYTDLNRVTACMDNLNERLTELGYQTGYQRIVVPHREMPSSRLPEGYQEVEYIQSSGTQYINTGFTPNQDTRVLVDIIFPGTTVATSKAVFGSRQTLTSKSFTFYSYNGHYSTTYNTVDNQCYPELIETRFLVDKNKNEITVNGTLYEQSYGVFSGQGPLYLFAINNNGSVFAQGEVFLYSCKIYDNETLVRDFIPCKEPSGEVGLYDLVSAQFYGNDGTGTFIPGPTPVSLPDGYTQVEYIQSSGTQYIDTGFKPNQDTRIVMDVYVQTQASFPKVIFGGRNGDTSSVDSFVFWAMTSTTFRTDYGNPTLSIAVTPSGRFAIDKNKNVTVLNGTNYTQNNATFQSGYNLAIFSLLDPGGVDARMCSMKLYSCQLYDNGTLIRDYVPCTDPSAAVGLYDLVGGVFYGNAGTGVFTAGPEIPPEPEPEPLDPYTWYEEDVPISSLLSAYLANVGNLKSTLTLPTGTPAVPDDMEGLTQTEANNIEKILEIINEYLVSLQKIFLRCGHAICGNNFYFAN